MPSSPRDLARLVDAVGDRYVVERELGVGGMATVYLAHDNKHGRQVAIKVLRPELYSAHFAERFLAEIRVTASLQHPHILPLFDSGAAGDLLYYVMPYVTGETLRDRLRRESQLAVADAVGIARDVASALAYAHGRGVIHRDIKPENILFHDGSPLIADFGIAISLTADASERLTATGQSIGTPTYMSPEQATGERTVDARTDVYALGAVLYEMLAGSPPYTGSSAHAVLAKLLTTDPVPLTALRADVPREVAAVVLQALAREPDARWSSAAAFASALHATYGLQTPISMPMSIGAAATQPRSSSPRSRAMMWTTAAVVAVAAGLLGMQYWPNAPSPPVVTGKRQVTFVGNVENVSLSPDGRFIAYAAHGEDSLSVFMKDLSGGNAITLATLANADVISLNWSPDGTRILLTAVAGTTPLVWVFPALGGNARQLPVLSLLDNIVPFGAWHPDGKHVALWPFNPSADDRVSLFGLERGDSSSLPLVGLPFASQGSFSPLSNNLVISQYSDSLFETWVVPASGAATRIARASSQDSMIGDPRWMPGDDAIVGLRGESDLVWIPLTRDGATAAGSPQVLTSGLEAWATDDVTALSVAADGRLAAYTRRVQHANLVLLDTGEQSRTLTNSTSQKWSGILSPDGRQVAFVQRDQRGNNVWLQDLSTGLARQITFSGAIQADSRSSCLAWSPAGDHLAMTTIVRGVQRLAVVTVNRNEPERIIEDSSPDCNGGITWAPSSKIVFTHASGHSIRSVDPETGKDSTILEDSTSLMFSGTLTPDGSRLAYYRMASDADASGLWVTTLDGAPKQLSARFEVPRGWTAAGDAVIAQSGGSRDILEVTLNGQSRVIARQTGRYDVCALTGLGLGAGMVCTAPVSVSDVWLIELSPP